MKITKTQLRRIIKEEKAKLLEYELDWSNAHSMYNAGGVEIRSTGQNNEGAYIQVLVDGQAVADGDYDFGSDCLWVGSGDLPQTHPRYRPGGAQVCFAELEELAAAFSEETVAEAALLEYEQYVDDEGNIYDDEGHVTRGGADFGRRFGGGTYGLNPPWGTMGAGGGDKRNDEQKAAIESALAQRSNSFLESILAQLKDGRGLSAKQKSVVRKIIVKYDPAAVSLFERRRRG